MISRVFTLALLSGLLYWSLLVYRSTMVVRSPLSTFGISAVFVTRNARPGKCLLTHDASVSSQMQIHLDFGVPIRRTSEIFCRNVVLPKIGIGECDDKVVITVKFRNLMDSFRKRCNCRVIHSMYIASYTSSFVPQPSAWRALRWRHQLGQVVFPARLLPEVGLILMAISFDSITHPKHTCPSW